MCLDHYRLRRQRQRDITESNPITGADALTDADTDTDPNTNSHADAERRHNVYHHIDRCIAEVDHRSARHPGDVHQ